MTLRRKGLRHCQVAGECYNFFGSNASYLGKTLHCTESAVRHSALDDSFSKLGTYSGDRLKVSRICDVQVNRFAHRKEGSSRHLFRGDGAVSNVDSTTARAASIRSRLRVGDAAAFQNSVDGFLMVNEIRSEKDTFNVQLVHAPPAG